MRATTSRCPSASKAAPPRPASRTSRNGRHAIVATRPSGSRWRRSRSCQARPPALCLRSARGRGEHFFFFFFKKKKKKKKKKKGGGGGGGGGGRSAFALRRCRAGGARMHVVRVVTEPGLTGRSTCSARCGSADRAARGDAPGVSHGYGRPLERVSASVDAVPGGRHGVGAVREVRWVWLRQVPVCRARRPPEDAHGSWTAPAVRFPEWCGRYARCNCGRCTRRVDRSAGWRPSIGVVLYLHGGGYVAGSIVSASRNLTGHLVGGDGLSGAGARLPLGTPVLAPGAGYR